MEAQRLTGALGAVLEDVKLETLDDDGFSELHDALMEHQVVFLRDQELSEDGHRALAERFGTPAVFPISRHFGVKEPLHVIEDGPDSPPDADGWHTDIPWIDQPPKVAILCALDVPPVGGDTMWLDLYGLYDRLSPPMQRALAPLRVRYTQGDEFWAAVGRALTAEQVAELREALPGAEHPLVRTHPVTGKPALYVAGDFMHEIVGMHANESAWLIEWLKRQVDVPSLQVRWQWRPGDVAIWDERCTNHRALSDHFPQRRRMRRCTVDGETPA